MRVQDRWYNRIIRDSLKNDRRYGRTICAEIPYINTKSLFEMQTKQQNKCWYCLCEMNWLERRTSKNGLTVERIDNALPHYVSNCTLACKRCNSRKFTFERGLLMRYFSKWKSVLDVKQNLKSNRTPSFMS